MTDKDTQYGTIIGSDAKFKGDFAFDSAARILGSIEGSITSKGVVHVANGASCKATVTAKEVSIEGVVEGNIEASDRVELKPNGAITGDIVAAKMTMADGASIDGYCRIGAGGKAKSATEVKPATSASTTSSPGKAEPMKSK